MSTGSENPTLECPQTALGGWPPPLAPAGPRARKRGCGLDIPFRRAIPCPADSPDVEATDPCGPDRSECGYNPGW